VADSRRVKADKLVPRGRGRRLLRWPLWRIVETCPVQRRMIDGAAEMSDGTARVTHRGEAGTPWAAEEADRDVPAVGVTQANAAALFA
jgi:hypothetical protein